MTPPGGQYGEPRLAESDSIQPTHWKPRKSDRGSPGDGSSKGQYTQLLWYRLATGKKFCILSPKIHHAPGHNLPTKPTRHKAKAEARSRAERPEIRHLDPVRVQTDLPHAGVPGPLKFRRE